MASAAREWQDICAAARQELARRTKGMQHLDACDCGHLMYAIEQAMANDVAAQSFDDWVDQQRTALQREAGFGG